MHSDLHALSGSSSLAWLRTALVGATCRAVRSALTFLAAAAAPTEEKVAPEWWDMSLCCLSSWVQTVDETRKGGLAGEEELVS